MAQIGQNLCGPACRAPHLQPHTHILRGCKALAAATAAAEPQCHGGLTIAFALAQRLTIAFALAQCELRLGGASLYDADAARLLVGLLAAGSCDCPQRASLCDELPGLVLWLVLGALVRCRG